MRAIGMQHKEDGRSDRLDRPSHQGVSLPLRPTYTIKEVSIDVLGKC